MSGDTLYYKPWKRCGICLFRNDTIGYRFRSVFSVQWWLDSLLCQNFQKAVRATKSNVVIRSTLTYIHWYVVRYIYIHSIQGIQIFNLTEILATDIDYFLYWYWDTSIWCKSNINKPTHIAEQFERWLKRHTCFTQQPWISSKAMLIFSFVIHDY